MRPRCFILQEILKRDPSTGTMQPVMDFRKVLEYGDPVVCLPSGRVGLTPGPTIDILRSKLRDFNDDDFIVPVGHPGVIALAGAIAAENNMGRFKMLIWDKDARQYLQVEYDLHHRIRKEN